MLIRNMNIKAAAERWQDNTVDEFDVVITFEQRIFETLVEDMRNRGNRKETKNGYDSNNNYDLNGKENGLGRESTEIDLMEGVEGIGSGQSLLVINIDVKDSAEEAAIATPLAIELCTRIDKCEDVSKSRNEK